MNQVQTISHPYYETMQKLNYDKNRLRFFLDNWSAIKETLSKNDLIFIVENMDVNHDQIIADLEKLGEYTPINEDIGFSDQ